MNDLWWPIFSDIFPIHDKTVLHYNDSLADNNKNSLGMQCITFDVYSLHE